MHVRGFFLTALTMIAMFALAAPAAKAQTITCSSDDGGRNYCPANTDGADVRMVRQRSDARCTQGYSWGYDRRGIWVDRGCRADFIVDYRHERHDDGHDSDGRGYGGGQTITCSSDDGKRNYCPADTRHGVRMVRQRSDARCTGLRPPRHLGRSRLPRRFRHPLTNQKAGATRPSLVEYNSPPKISVRPADPVRARRAEHIQIHCVLHRLCTVRNIRRDHQDLSRAHRDFPVR